MDMGEDEELLDLLEQTHLNHVLIGIESTNQKALDAVNKGQRGSRSRQSRVKATAPRRSGCWVPATRRG